MNKLPCIIALATFSSLFALACSCTEVGCIIGADEGVRVVVENAGPTYAGSLPVTFQLCVDATCADFTLEEKDGQVVCDDHQGASGTDTRACWLMNGQKDLELILATDMPDDSSEVHLTIKDAENTQLFDDTTSVSVTESEPNGPTCGPTCRTAQADFEVGAVSQ